MLAEVQWLVSFLLGGDLSISAEAWSRAQVQKHKVQDSSLRLGKK